MNANASTQIQNEYLMMTALYSVVIATCLAMHNSVIVAVWLVPLLLWSPVHALIELPEHWDTAPRPNEDAFQNTRTITAGSFGTYFTNSNCFHVEHHRYAAIPLQRLSALHEALVQGGARYRYLEQSYPAFYLKFLVALWLGPAKKSEEIVPLSQQGG